MVASHADSGIILIFMHDGHKLTVVGNIIKMDTPNLEAPKVEGHQWEYITKTIKADIRVLDLPLLDTKSSRDNDVDRGVMNDANN